MGHQNLIGNIRNPSLGDNRPIMPADLVIEWPPQAVVHRFLQQEHESRPAGVSTPAVNNGALRDYQGGFSGCGSKIPNQYV